MQQEFYDLIIPGGILAERMCLEDVTLVILAFSWNVVVKDSNPFTHFFLNTKLLAKLG